MIDVIWLAFAIVVFVVILAVVVMHHRRSMAALQYQEKRLLNLFNGAVDRYVEAEAKLLEIYQTENEEK